MKLVRRLLKRLKRCRPRRSPPSRTGGSSPAVSRALGPRTAVLQAPELLIDILGHLDRRSLGRASQFSQLWLDARTVARTGSVMPGDVPIGEGALAWLVARLHERPRLAHYVKHWSLPQPVYQDTTTHPP